MMKQINANDLECGMIIKDGNGLIQKIVKVEKRNNVMRCIFMAQFFDEEQHVTFFGSDEKVSLLKK